jgi:hypothetical protein
MNKTEQVYAELLSQRILLNEVTGWRYEAIKLRLADNTFYTPDFWVQLPSGEIELHEVKACKADDSFLCEDDAAVKIKVAAEMYPEFGFLMCGRLTGGRGWRIESIGRKSS